MNIIGEMRILKDDRGVYKTALVNTENNNETGEEEKIFMRINVGFKKGVEVKHKTKINVKEGFMTFFRIPTGNTHENGTPEYRYFPKLVVLDFDVVEEGVDEVQQTRDYSKTQDNEMSNTYSITSEEYNEYTDDLPF